MKFIIEPEHGIKQDTVIVWDAEKGQELCTFTGGEFETEDQYIIGKLTELGYESDGEQQKQADDDEIILAAMREKAKALGITHTHVKGVEKLTAEIAEKEGN